MKCFARFSLHLCICVALIGKAFAIAPENGWWWNPSESGSGYAIERQGNSLFMAAFLYEPTGAATWYATGLALQPDGSYKGEMMRYVGGKSLLGAYKPTTSNSVVATASLTFPTPDTGVMTISFASGAAPRTVPITRFAFGSPAFDPSNGSFQNGWWWNDQESGTGYFIEVQGASAFIASFMYDAAGQPTWYASGAGLSGTQLLSGPLDMYANGQSLGGTYKAPTSKAGAAGVMSYDFTSDSAGSMTLPNAAKVAIQRFVFDPTAVTNHIPVPNAGSNQTVSVGDTVYLNGTATDTDKDPLSFYWRLVTVPTGSKASLVDGQTTKPYFVADVAGTYRVLLLADDGKSSNGQSVVTVTGKPKTSTNTPPVANAGANQTVAVGTAVKLTGAASSDANGDALTYAWFFVTRPSGSLASLTGATTVSPGFTADVAGNYVIGLNVNDGKASSAQSSVTVVATAANTAPVANAGPSQTVLVGTVVSLNGSASSDANGDALTYAWTLTRPTGSSAVLNNSKSMATSFTADLAGAYSLTLVVNDGKANSLPSSVAINASSESSLNASATCKLPTTHPGYGVYLGFPNRPNGLKAIGTVNVPVAMVDFPDAVATMTPQDAFKLVAPGAAEFFLAASYGQMKLELTPSMRWDRMSKASAEYNMARGTNTYANHYAYSLEALTLAAKTLDFSNADGFLVLTNPAASGISLGPAFATSPGFGITINGRSLVSGATSAYPLTAWGPKWLNHELGHALGLVDLYDANPGTLSGNHFVGEFSIMNKILGLAPMLFAWESWQIGWLTDAQITCAPTGNTVVTLTPIEDAGGMKAVIVPTGKYSAIVVESRRAKGLDSKLTRGGALVYLVDTQVNTGAGVIKVLPLDDTDESKINKLLNVGQSVTYQGVTVTLQELSNGNDVVSVIRP